MVKLCIKLNGEMVKWLNCCNGDLVKYQNVMVLFSYLRVLILLPFLSILNRSGGGCPHLFLFNFYPSHTLYLGLCLSLPLQKNISPHHAILSLPLPLPHNLCLTHPTLSIFLPIIIPHHLFPPHSPLSLPIYLPHNIFTPCAPLYIYLSIHIPHPPSLYQCFPCCHSYPNTIQTIQLI